MATIKLSIFFLFLIVLSSFVMLHTDKVSIVFIGDSITHGAGLNHPETESPPVIAVEYLKQTGFADVKFSNQGVSGFTTVDFLPNTHKAYANVIAAADNFYKEDKNGLVFSVMLGTNDSAVKGPNGSPVTPADYRNNLKTIADSLFERYPECKVIFNEPLWYSDSTQNRSVYLVEGRERLKSYVPEIKRLVKAYRTTKPDQVFLGDRNGYNYFKKNYLTDMQAEKGVIGRFYLHPNANGAKALGNLWGKAIADVLK